MHLRPAALVISALSLLALSPARALCIYKGQMYAKTTLSQEFSDARWVVKAKVLAADNHSSDEDDSWTIYHLGVLTAFKGKPPLRLELFTYRNSGGFYLDRSMSPDLGGEYLLFLDPISQEANLPAAARNATEVNYNCGQSRPWPEVSGESRKQLATLARASR